MSQSPISDRWEGSGIPYSSARALQKYVGDVIELGPFPLCTPGRARRVWWRLLHMLTGRLYRWKSSRDCCREMASRVKKALDENECDIVFASMALWTIALLEDDRPVFSFSDSTLIATHRMGGYTGSYPLTPGSYRESVDIEGRFACRADGVLVASHWTRESLESDYGVDSGRVFVTPFGANLEPPEVPSLEEVRDAIQTRSDNGVCRILFVGRDWHRKGGDIVVETVSELRRRGIDAHLQIIGSNPTEPIDSPYVTVTGRVDKNDPEQTAALTRAFLEADFFMMPSRAEAYGIVYAEASAFGLPSVAADVGGVSEVVRDGENGILLPAGSSADEYADAIARVYRDRRRYFDLANRARELFEEEFNWEVWGERVRDIVERVLSADLARKVDGCAGRMKSQEMRSGARQSGYVPFTGD